MYSNSQALEMKSLSVQKQIVLQYYGRFCFYFAFFLMVLSHMYGSYVKEMVSFFKLGSIGLIMLKYPTKDPRYFFYSLCTIIANVT